MPDRSDDGALPQDAVETVQVGDRWVNRMVGTGSIVSVDRNRSTALAAGAALAKEWRVHHHVVYTSASSTPADE